MLAGGAAAEQDFPCALSLSSLQICTYITIKKAQAKHTNWSSPRQQLCRSSRGSAAMPQPQLELQRWLSQQGHSRELRCSHTSSRPPGL